MNLLLLPRFLLVAALTLTIASTTAAAGMNPIVSLPLHAKASSFEPCNAYLPVDCMSVDPVVNVLPGPTAVFLLIYHFTAVAGVQTAFQPDPTWTFTFGLWDCQPGQLNAVTPGPPFGPTAGTITTAFNCLSGPDLGVIGRMFFVAGGAGCLRQVQSSYPFGIHVLDCQLGIDQISPNHYWRLGKICIETGGETGCWISSAVSPATWGSIKAQYE